MYLSYSLGSRCLPNTQSIITYPSISGHSCVIHLIPSLVNYLFFTQLSIQAIRHFLQRGCSQFSGVYISSLYFSSVHNGHAYGCSPVISLTRPIKSNSSKSLFGRPSLQPLHCTSVLLFSKIFSAKSSKHCLQIVQSELQRFFGNSASSSGRRHSQHILGRLANSSSRIRFCGYNDKHF